MMYAAEIVDGMVTQVIVGDAAWATDRLGGMWMDSADLVGIGWAYSDGQFTPPVYPDADSEELP